jgi:hypothetical protein
MPFALIIIGVIFLIASVKNTVQTTPNGGPGLYPLLVSDFTGSNNFIFWFVAMLIIGAVGYIQKLKPVSVALLTLVVLVLFLKKGNPSGVGGGFFSQFTSGIGTTQQVQPAINQGAAASVGGSSLTSLLSGVEGQTLPSPVTVQPAINNGSAASDGGQNLLNLLGA